MLKRSWSNIVTIGCLVVVAFVEAAEQAISQSPHIASLLPHISGAWHYLPLVLLTLAGISWILGQRHGRQRIPASSAQPNLFNRPRWEIVSGCRFENESLDVDGKSFRNCTFKNVTFRFHGIAPTEFTGNSQFGGSIRLSTDHPPTMFWRELERRFSTIPDAEVETFPVNETGQKIKANIIAAPIEALPEIRPKIIPIRYGQAGDAPRQIDGRWYRSDNTEFTTGEILAGKHRVGAYGLYVENECEESAFDVSISDAPLGKATLKFRSCLPRLTKAQGHVFFESFIERGPGDILSGADLFEEMRQRDIPEVLISIKYKDSASRGFQTLGKIERDVLAAGGLTVRFIGQKTSA